MSLYLARTISMYTLANYPFEVKKKKPLKQLRFDGTLDILYHGQYIREKDDR